MVLDLRDTEILRLAGRYRWLPYEGYDRYGLGDLDAEILKLVRLGLLKASKHREYIRLSNDGRELLAKAGYSYSLNGRRAYSGSLTLMRRLETVSIVLTCLRAGIDTLQDDMKSLFNQPVFYPAFALRPAMMNSANCGGFGHWGNTAFMLQYISPESPGMYRTNEFSTFYNLSSMFRERSDTPMALILTGESYADIYKQLTCSSPSSRHGNNGFSDFREVYSNVDMPVHLVACNETGARQLAVMSQPDYRTKIAKSAYRQKWTERDAQIPAADGCIDGIPLVIAVDMDLHRLKTVVNAARSLSRKKVLVAAFEEQIREVLYTLYSGDNSVSFLKIEEPVLDAAFSSIRLYSMDTAPAFSDGGGAIHA